MPSIEEHTNISLKRTGKKYSEVHEWLDGKNVRDEEKIARHDILNIPKFLPIVKKRFGSEGGKEYLQHIKDDCGNTILLKIFKTIKRIKFWK